MSRSSASTSTASASFSYVEPSHIDNIAAADSYGQWLHHKHKFPIDIHSVSLWKISLFLPKAKKISKTAQSQPRLATASSVVSRSQQLQFQGRGLVFKFPYNLAAVSPRITNPLRLFGSHLQACMSCTTFFLKAVSARLAIIISSTHARVSASTSPAYVHKKQSTNSTSCTYS